MPVAKTDSYKKSEKCKNLATNSLKNWHFYGSIRVAAT
jgi:hypothetical protein